MPEANLKLAILAAYQRLLRPLVRILIRNGVSFAEFSEIAKDVYVEVAERDFQLPDKNMTQGRIAILTGLTRTEVNRLITQRGSQHRDYASNLNRVTRILSGWHTDPQFTGPYGLPLDVPFDSPDNRSFSELVRRYTGNMPARAMLDELLRIGLVKESDNGRLKVLTRAYLPKADEPESLDRLGNVVRNFVETQDFNRAEANPENRLFERQVVADAGIRATDLPRFQAHVRERGQFLLEELDDWLSKLEPIDNADSATVVNTGVGIYHYIRREDD
jgi:hypothetical protein